MTVLCATVEEPPLNGPPAAPVAGQCFLVGGVPTGAWVGKSGWIAGFSDGGWRFVEPPEGAQVMVRTSGETMLRRNGAWETGIVRAQEVQVAGKKIVGSRQPAIAAPIAGSTIDAEARSTIAAIVAALQAHGLIET